MTDAAITRAANPTAAKPAADGSMIWVNGGQFMMGSDSHYPEEAPRHAVQVDGFWIDGVLFNVSIKGPIVGGIVKF